MGKFIDLTGKRFGRWTVLALHPERHLNGGTLWLCRCGCGTERVKRGNELRRRYGSCGCLRAEVQRKRLTKHGMSGTRIYRIWSAMRQRCFNPNNKRYADYGERGIGIDWENFEELYADVGDPPPGMSLDRRDNNRNYGPSNWRWADAVTQANNKRPRRKKSEKQKLGSFAVEEVPPPF